MPCPEDDEQFDYESAEEGPPLHGMWNEPVWRSSGDNAESKAEQNVSSFVDHHDPFV
jgi:hypothetical protein